MDTLTCARNGVRTAVMTALGVVALGANSLALADGTEVLGSPSIAVADGSGIEAAGVGIEAPDGSTLNAATVNLNLGAGRTPVQTIAYWQGFFPDGFTRPGSFALDIEGTEYTGEYVGGDTTSRGTQFGTYRADITGVPLAAGANAIDFEGFNDEPGFEGNGAGVLVIYDDGSISDVDLFDGSDRAYFLAQPPFDTTVPVTFNFTPVGVDRVATLSLFFADVSGTRSGGGFRPTTILVDDGMQEQEFNNILDSTDGAEWDTVIIPVNVAAGIDSFTVQALSEDRAMDPNTGDPASFSWIAAGASIPIPPDGGGQGCTPGYWRQPHHFADWTAPYDPSDLFSSVFEDAFPGMTLRQVVRIRGGGINALGRHTVAALLNAASSEVDYDMSPQEVIDAFNTVYPGNRPNYNALKDEFEDFNEQGCPLNNSDGSNFASRDESVTVVAASSDASGSTEGTTVKKKGKKKGLNRGKGKKKGHYK